MAARSTLATSDLRHRATRWLATPVSTGWCAVSWVVATALFVGIVALFGGPSQVDIHETDYGTWAVSHGQLACAFHPSDIAGSTPPAAPLYPLVSGGVAALAHVAHGGGFPSVTALGPGCAAGSGAMDHWAFRTGGLSPTAWLGILGWLALMVGVIAWLRASGWGRCGWEPATVLALAVLPPVWLCVQSTFHPQDLLAMGLALAALAASIRGRWISAGILVGLAVLSQQFALLVAVPLLVLAPPRRRAPYALGALATTMLVIAPLTILSGRDALRATTFGSAYHPSSDGAGTILWELHLSTGSAAAVIARGAPLVLSLIASLCFSRRLGARAPTAVAMTALVTFSLGLRLLFEVSLFGYYFMAFTVGVVLVSIAQRRVDRVFVAWVLAVSLVTMTPQFGLEDEVRTLISLAVIAGTLLLALFAARHRESGVALLWLAIAGCAVLTRPGTNLFTEAHLSNWFWQLILLIPGFCIAARPLLAELRANQRSGSSHTSLALV